MCSVLEKNAHVYIDAKTYKNVDLLKSLVFEK